MRTSIAMARYRANARLVHAREAARRSLRDVGLGSADCGAPPSRDCPGSPTLRRSVTVSRRACCRSCSAIGASDAPQRAKCASSASATTSTLEVVRVANFVALPPAAATFARAVQRSHGIYRHRWGDAIIRRLELTLMVSKVLHLDELAPHFPSTATATCACLETRSLSQVPSGKVDYVELPFI